MDADVARSLFLPFHGTVGVLALVGGFGALAVTKGSPAHVRLGWLFAGSMAFAVLFALPVLWATQNVFLAGLGVFAAYMTVVGVRVARVKNKAGSAFDRGVSIAMIGFGLCFAAFGLVALGRGQMIGVVPVAMGGGGALLARRHLRWFRADPGARDRWVSVHLGAIGGALIAALTAFGAAVLTNWVPMIPEPLVWLTPTLVLSPVLRRASGKFA